MQDDLKLLGKRNLEHEILAYLAEHPDARDTAEGIAQWWLLEQEIKFQKEKVKEALAELVDKGLIIAHRGDSSHVHYRFNQNKLEKIRAILAREQCGK